MDPAICILPPKVLVTIINHFNISNPSILGNNLTVIEKINLFKELSDDGHSTNIHLNYSNRYPSFILKVSDIRNFNWEIQTDAPALVLSKIQTERELNSVNLPIDAEVYFVDQITLRIYEAYAIKNKHISRYLGQFIVQLDGSISYKKSIDYEESLFKRRGNFNGIELIGMTEITPPQISIPNDFQSKGYYWLTSTYFTFHYVTPEVTMGSDLNKCY